MLHEINANAALPTSPVNLRADGEGIGTIDGGPGFALTVTLGAGDPVEITTYGSDPVEVADGPDDHGKPKGKTKTTDDGPHVIELGVGQSATIRSRAQFKTVGISSWVTFGRHGSDESLRTERLGKVA